MAPAEDAGAAALAASASGRRRRGWGSAFCFGSRRRRGPGEEEEALPVVVPGTPWAGSRRSKRTVPVDADVEARTVDDAEAMRRGADGEESRARGCCFLPPGRAPGSKQSTKDGSKFHTATSKQRQQEHAPRSQEATNPPPSKTASAPRLQATASTGGRPRPRRAEQPRAAPEDITPAPPPATPQDAGAKPSKNQASSSVRASRTTTKAPAAAGVGHGGEMAAGAFGPAVGLSVVAAVSMAGLLGGRLWAVACVCAWLAALSRLRRLGAPVAAGGAAGGGGEDDAAVVDVDSTDYKKLVVLRGLLERDRTKAVAG